MEPKDQLVQTAMLGAMFEETSKEQTRAFSPTQMEKVIVQIEAAGICVDAAIQELDKIPGTGGLLLLFELRMIVIQLAGAKKQLEGV